MGAGGSRTRCVSPLPPRGPEAYTGRVVTTDSTESIAAADGGDWKSDLRQRGYRLTPQRQLVLEAVDALEHATPDEILAEVRKTASGVNISTVYRTLELLEELKLVSHAHLGHGAPTYHLADRHHHIHLVCRDCGDVIEADVDVAAEFTSKLRAGFGFETDMKHFAIFGRCKKCAAKRHDEPGGRP
ncbi:Fur family transcriptional regulator [Streptomyces sp. NBC_00096]|uniref:Fur family transcriptional regulator n=1 Tax=Streptomyces sp. NBC_00096 TaxID=2975650 RepID=UPI0038693B1F